MSGLEMKYFMLEPKGSDIYAEASRAAIRAYADVICNENSQLADELVDWTNVEEANSQKELVEIDVDDETLFKVMKMAHEQDITLNQLVENILREEIEND